MFFFRSAKIDRMKKTIQRIKNPIFLKVGTKTIPKLFHDENFVDSCFSFDLDIFLGLSKHTVPILKKIAQLAVF